MSKKDVRARFRNEVIGRDNYKCRLCDRDDDIVAHHITDRHDMPNDGYVKENGIALCPYHHIQAEVYHRSRGREGVEGMWPDDLYRIIGSSKEIAIKKSKNRISGFEKEFVL